MRHGLQPVFRASNRLIRSRAVPGGSAAERDESRSRFYVVEGENDLQEILSAPLEQWRVFLHPTQRRLASSNLNGPSRILGGAGTGKAVLAMHRAKNLASTLVGKDQKLLFTTFTTNLALDIEDGLKSICSPEQIQRIDIINLDALAFRFLKVRRYEHEIAFDFEAKCAPVWESAMVDFDPSLRSPWPAASDLGKCCRDGFASLTKTCRKLGVSFWDYLGDHIGQHEAIAPLPDIIRERAAAALAMP